MIPKKIHYCWFGRKNLPKLAKHCIASWEKFLPDYEIIEWDEDNFDINCCDYVKEAYQAKKYAFVSDVARFKVLYEQGGLYFDTDVELIKPIDDIIEKGPFMGFENDKNVNPGLGLAVSPGLGLYKEIIKFYENIHFINNKGNLNLKTVVKYTTEILDEHGLKRNNKMQQVAGIYIYPKEYFNPKDFRTKKITITNNTRSIHHYDASWHSLYGKFKLFIVSLSGKNARYIFMIKNFFIKR